MRRDKLSYLLFLGIVLLGIGFRAFWLDKESLWLDEFTSLEVSSTSPSEILGGKNFDHHTPPAYYILSHLWLATFGESTVSLRSFSALTDCVAILLMFILGSLLHSRQFGLVLASLYSVSPFAVYYAREARMYSLLSVLIALLLIYTLKALRNEINYRTVLPLSLLIAFGAYTHYYFLFVVAGLSLALIVEWRWKSGQITFTSLKKWLISCTIAAVLYLPWLHIVFSLLQSGGQAFRSSNWLSLLAVIPYTFLRFVAGYALFPITLSQKLDPKGSLAGELWWILPFVFLFSLVFGRGLLGCVRIRPVCRPLLFCFFFTPLFALLVSLKVPMFSERYLVSIMPIFIIIIGFGLVDEHFKVRAKTLSLVVSLWITANLALFLNPTFGTAMWRESAQILLEAHPKPEIVVVNPEYYKGILNHYLKGEIRVISYDKLNEAVENAKALTLIETGVTPTLVPELGGLGFKKTSTTVLPKEIGVLIHEFTVDPSM